MKESDIQNQIRICVSQQGLGILFRANVGEGWTGEKIVKNLDGSITIHNPRRLKTGLPVGFSDLFGVTENGKAVFVEVKSATGRLRQEQENFLKRMRQMGAYAGVARSPEDAERIFRVAEVR
ncbi:conserved hypothetical protein [Desulforamulus reducens MI-1]|uniref:VRR-NUC domain-containing protein n=1 Tax=Desulforamulus reducens (strain ATCC BAA-1160 / DSM 100696 / MI-1) TaxID=349161 RepID=A4J7S2_DESRM|nr:VRR-NUC domain-containing protein [Desulforamulus reducens]ABO51125.1 conserved hypothetical protein [Desulforamulus reducens MI-1]